jgi:PKD repeat protein
MYGPEGANDMTASKTGFGSDTRHPVVPHFGAVLQNFNLTAGRLQTNVSSMSAEMLPTMTTTETLTITNTGSAPATYTLKELNAPLRASVTTSHGTKASIMNWRKQASKLEKIQAQATNSVPCSAKGLNLPAAPSTKPYAAGDVISSWASGLSMAWGVAYDGNDNTVWVSSPSSYWGGTNTIYEYTPAGTPTGRSYSYTWAPPYGPADVCFNWLTGNLWVMNLYSPNNCIYEINPATGVTGTTICPAFSTYMYGLAYDPATDTYFAGGWNDYMIHHFSSTGAILDEVYVGLSISGLAYNPDTQHLFVMVNDYQNPVYVLDAANSYSILGSFTIAGFGEYSGAGLEIDCNGHLWAVNQTTGMVYEVDSGETTSVCYTDVPWLSEAPTTGTLGPGEHVDIAVTYDSTGLSAGAYHAQLKIANDTPYDIAKVPVTLNVLPALAVSTAANSTTGMAPLLVSFTSTVSNGYGPYTYDWDFGDGSPHANGANPSHRFTNPGTYQIRLQVHDSGDPSHVPPLPAQTASDAHITVIVTAGVVDRVPYSVVPTKITSTNNGQDGTVTWDASNCPSENYHIIYGMGSGLSTWKISGGKCAIGYSGTYTWSSIPNPTADPSHFLWFLVVGNDSGVSEGSWGQTSAGDERGGATASGQCSCTTKVTTTTCGTSPNMPQR